MILSVPQIQTKIKEIDAVFHSFQLEGSTREILEILACFEKKTVESIEVMELNAVVKWYKSLFFQKVFLFQRAEELLDEALDAIDGKKEQYLCRWKVKIYISLGYVHRAQWNYQDAEFYLTGALELAKSLPELHKFLGEIYSSLSQVSLLLSQHHQASRYAIHEKKVCLEHYQSAPSEKNNAIIYAYALINYSRIRRLIGVLDHENEENLREAAEISSIFSNEKCSIICALETAEFKFAARQMGEALDMALSLESSLKSQGLIKEALQAGLLAAKVYGEILDYELAEVKFNEIIQQSQAQHLKVGEIAADAYYGLGQICYRMDQEQRAYDFFRQSARMGMVLGIKDIIIRSFEAARTIDKYKARELLSSSLAYQDAAFVRNRLSRSFSPFKSSRIRTRLFATTLFVDIVGFSSLMKMSDESLTIQMVDEFIDRMSLIIYQYNGYIDKFLGDGFMAIFEHGNHISSKKVMDAICSGIDIYRALKHKNRKLGAVYGADTKINVRIGISTGEIFAMILGNYIKTEFTYLGNSVNLASKLESRASNQYMLIDEETWLQAKDRIVSEPEDIIIPGLGKTSVHKVLRLARMNKRPDLSAAKTQKTQ
ncbi:Adenylate cyclase, class 3 [Desulfocicer vacuolatum DSM 3385]|uniref:Adenylate cyclase, class 3 n=1 Tax=Desulfocicer vacuolatum DSM 3385 TaxID=1121400 RepID=A0A1W2B069_9BACT|nr:adenylate/guanylate cyclase domain-containing protein [Desulfocicer vacuolatum]SMC66180.1 Adenylate cyclase, class 3 [Desulfocicer vacuolatum DSM 3385]